MWSSEVSEPCRLGAGLWEAQGYRGVLNLDPENFQEPPLPRPHGLCLILRALTSYLNLTTFLGSFGKNLTWKILM